MTDDARSVRLLGPFARGSGGHRFRRTPVTRSASPSQEGGSPDVSASTATSPVRATANCRRDSAWSSTSPKARGPPRRRTSASSDPAPEQARHRKEGAGRSWLAALIHDAERGTSTPMLQAAPAMSPSASGAVRAPRRRRAPCLPGWAAPALAGIPGLEPELTEPETVGLPIPYPVAEDRGARPTVRALRVSLYGLAYSTRALRDAP